jgi:hypothetical protein
MALKNLNYTYHRYIIAFKQLFVEGVSICIENRVLRKGQNLTSFSNMMRFGGLSLQHIAIVSKIEHNKPESMPLEFLGRPARNSEIDVLGYWFI